ncbi:TPA: holo-[acyl-carrier-protein] synthase [bacterium]|nr:holo-[acyl-carrier-protein] synthase [bacterium]
MTIFGTGIDLVEIKRFADVVDRFGERFLKRVFTESELAYCLSRPNFEMHLAARFAAKEAVSKALGTGWGSFSWRDIEVNNDPSGAPKVNLSGGAAKIFAESKGEGMLISISHTKDMAIAQAIIIKGKREEG